MDLEKCSICPYYQGKVIPLAGGSSIVEQCEKKYWDANNVPSEIKYGLPNSNVICVDSANYRYSMKVLIGEYKRLESIQITKEEFDTFEHWKSDLNVIDSIISRKLGCDKCREALINLRPENCMNLIMTSFVMQADLWQCQFCGTYWEYGVYRKTIVDKSFVQYNYLSDNKESVK